MVLPTTAQKSPHYREKIGKLLDILNIQYQNIELYILAFVHRSIVNERNDFTPEHNERLEFLGDAVLELAITQELYKNFPNTQEGEMTDMRSALVRGRNLSEVARSMKFQEYLFLGKGEEKSGGRENDYILANTLEAFLGALYLDTGYQKTQDFIIDQIYTTLPNILEQKLFKDFKTLIQEYSQAHFDITPHYEVISESGPDHNKEYIVGVYLAEKCIGKGSGSSKKKGQESAAENAYITLNKQ